MLGFTVIEMCTETDEETCERVWWLEHGERKLKLQIIVHQVYVKDGSDLWHALTIDIRTQSLICKFKTHDPTESLDAMGERVLKLALWYMDEPRPGFVQGSSTAH